MSTFFSFARANRAKERWGILADSTCFDKTRFKKFYAVWPLCKTSACFNLSKTCLSMFYGKPFTVWTGLKPWLWRLLFGQFVKASFKSDNPPPDSTHANDQLSPMYATPGFKPFSILCSATCCNQLNLILIRDLLSSLGLFWTTSNYFPQIIPGHPTFVTVGQKVSQSSIMFISKAANLLRTWKENNVAENSVVLMNWSDRLSGILNMIYEGKNL